VGGARRLVLAHCTGYSIQEEVPKWWFDWNSALTKFSLRVMAFVLLLRDEFPALEDDQAVAVELAYPDASKDLVQGHAARKVVPCYSPHCHSYLSACGRCYCDRCSLVCDSISPAGILQKSMHLLWASCGGVCG